MSEITREEIESYFDEVAEIAYEKFGFGVTNKIKSLALERLDMDLEAAAKTIKEKVNE